MSESQPVQGVGVGPGVQTQAGPTGSAAPLWKSRYRIEKEIGHGGFGVVYLARDQELLSKPVVIKVLQDSSPDPYFLKKFHQEMEALARIDHPGVVGVLDIGESPEGKPFLVMQFVEGATLRSAIAPGGMEFGRAASILRQMCQALGAAHDKGVFHRDLKPENVMLQKSGDREEYVKLIDFGVAAVRNSQIALDTPNSRAVGTLAYMAPEQVLGTGSAATGASDVYALGVIAYEMLAGVRPENSHQGVSVKPRELRPAIPEPAEAAVLAALSYQPEKRPAGPRAFGDWIAPALTAAVTSTAPSSASAAPTGVSTPAAPTSANLETAYVLFMDLVSYSMLPMDVQSQRIQSLQQIVRSTPEFQRAQQSQQIISLPTGDGMALVFFQNPVAPVQCAIEISRALKSNPNLRLRMGVNSGLVYRIADINANFNVAGGGINMAQRVMDCGDAGHILLSKAVADDLGQLSDWAPFLHDLGDAEVKHGVKVHVVNLVTPDAGNAEMPEKLKKRVAATVAGAPAMAATAAQRIASAAPQTTASLASPRSSRRDLYLAGGALAAVVVGVVLLGPWHKSASPASGTSQATAPGAVSTQPVSPEPTAKQSADTPGPPPAIPPSVTSGNTPPPGQPSGEPLKASQTASAQTSPAMPAASRSITAAKSAPAAVTSAAAAPPPSAQTVPPAAAAPAPADPARQAAVQAQRERMIQLAARGGAVTRSMDRMEQQQKSQGVGMRADMAAAKDSFQYLMDEAKSALAAGDADTAQHNLDMADTQLTKLEHFLGL